MLAAERRARILSLARHHGAVGISNLVNELGVSHVTIRRDLDALVAEGTLEKVRGGAILRHGADDGPTFGDAPQEDVGTVAVIVPTSYYYRQVVDGINAALSGRGGEMRLGISDYDLDEERRLVGEFAEAGVSGLLWAPSVLERADNADFVQLAEDLPIPAVLVEREIPGGGLGALSTVRSAHERGAFSAMRHLRDLGHRRIAMVSRGRTQTADFVRTGWRDALDRLDLDSESPVIGPDELGSQPTWPRGGSEIVLDVIQSSQATALFSHGDENSLFLLLQAARARGMSVPEDLSIVTYDDDVSAHADPALSAVAPDKYRVGTLAVRMLFDSLLRPHDWPPLHLQVEPRLLIRASTAAPRAD
jgi:DNA-binding LacI/PurR family transcriptional regulator